MLSTTFHCKINTHAIKTVKSAKYLGVIISYGLNISLELLFKPNLQLSPLKLNSKLLMIWLTSLAPLSIHHHMLFVVITSFLHLKLRIESFKNSFFHQAMPEVN